MRKGEVRVNGIRAGVLEETAPGFRFRYDRDYAEQSSLPAVSLTLSKQTAPYESSVQKRWRIYSQTDSFHPLPALQTDVPANEHLTMQIANQLFGITVPLKLGVAIADHWEGPYRRARPNPLDEFNGPETDIEDPYLWWQDDHFEAIFKDMTGKICGEHHGGIHALSADGIHWRLAGDPLAYSRKLLWDDGTTTHQGQFERPQLLIQDG